MWNNLTFYFSSDILLVEFPYISESGLAISCCITSLKGGFPISLFLAADPHFNLLLPTRFRPLLVIETALHVDF
jgi:hypothetical protein